MSKTKKTNHKNGLLNRVISRSVTLLAHRYFFFATTSLFALQMLWIAVSATYPMLFDEEFHLGIIEIYSRQLSPFIATQPAEAAFHGDITRYGSYFFHYLMSFPYRIVAALTPDLQTQVIIMRVICIAFILLGFTVFRKVLLNMKLSKATSHAILLVFILIPIVPFALAQLNYDSLVFVWVPLMLLISQKIAADKKRQTFWILLLISIGSLAAITKFTTLPIFVGCLMFAAFQLGKQSPKKIVTRLLKQYRAIPSMKRILLSLLVLVSIGLFIERYGVNIVSYRALEPRCNRIHPDHTCMNYTVFRRDTTWKQANDAKNTPRDDALTYTTQRWLPHIFGDLFVVGAFVRDTDPTIELRELPKDLQANGGSRILRTIGWVVLALGVTLLIARFRYLVKNKTVTLFLLCLFIYTLALWIKNYTDYINIGVAVATQGRYFIPLLIPILSIVVLAASPLIRRYDIKLFLLIAALACFSQGGGVANYILHSKPSWYWPGGRQTITEMNQTAKRLLRTFQGR